MKLAILDRIGPSQTEGDDVAAAFQAWVAQDGVLEAIASLNRNGWHVTMAANYPQLGRGSLDVNELNGIHLRLQRDLAEGGAKLEAVFFCPHTQQEQCTCRKPAAGLLQQIAMRYGAEPHEVWVIGHDRQHLLAGQAMGAHVLWLPAPDTVQPADTHLQAHVVPNWKSLVQALADNA